MMKHFWILLLLLPALAFAETKKIEGTTNVEDAQIGSANPDYNYGGGNALSVRDVYSSLVRVKNLASELGAGATISSCVCSVYMTGGSFPIEISAYRVFKPWGEGTLNGSDPADAALGEGVVTWNDWSNDDEEWTTAGCGSADDGGSDNSGDGTGADRKATPEDTKNITAPGWYEFVVSPSLAQDWYDGEANENGIIFVRTSGTYAWFISTEFTDQQLFWVFVYEITSVHVRDVHLRKVQL